jgi:hypothetical protein
LKYEKLFYRNKKQFNILYGYDNKEVSDNIITIQNSSINELKKKAKTNKTSNKTNSKNNNKNNDNNCDGVLHRTLPHAFTGTTR